MLRAAWNNPTGGVRYHVRALLHARAWRDYRAGLVEWLSRWRPGRPALALVGPSAGHCLPYAALTQFERFVVFEIDPVARVLLRRRLERELPGRPIQVVADDVWIGPVRLDGQVPSSLFDADTALLFCNFIGQVSFMLDPGEYPAFQKAWTASLFPHLSQTPWASFHDRVSGVVPPHEALPSHGRYLDDSEVAALYEGDPDRELIELNDHRSQELLPEGYDYRYLHWPLTQHMHHLIECVLGGPQSPSDNPAPAYPTG